MLSWVEVDNGSREKCAAYVLGRLYAITISRRQLSGGFSSSGAL